MAESYKCPGCGASLVYEEGSKELSCPYCGMKVSIDALSGQEIQSEPTRASETSVFHCDSCGGELATDEYTAATVCPFCGSPSIIRERLDGSRKPDLLIPFAFGKEKAQEIFREWTKQGFFTPKGFHSKNTLDSITGLYVPYWLFDMEADVDMEAAATRVRVTRSGQYEYTYTDHYRLYRKTRTNFERIPADASIKMPDDTMDRLEPFSYQELRAFEAPYLSGYMAECSNFDPEQLRPRVEERAKSFAVDATRHMMQGYTTVSVTDTRFSGKPGKKEYAMLPVWVLNYRYGGKNWSLYLNGQTGRRIGSLPVDKGKVALCYTAVSLVITALSALIWGFIL